MNCLGQDGGGTGKDQRKDGTFGLRSASSWHRGGVNLAYADGSVRFTRNEVDHKAYTGRFSLDREEITVAEDSNEADLYGLQASVQSNEELLRQRRALYALARTGRQRPGRDSSSTFFGLEDPSRSVPSISLHTVILSNSVATDADLIHLAAFPELKRLSLSSSKLC